ncbi:hypothetical protein IMSAGC013_02583 [Lachnospiraceae bacterium]|jgi:hypothetical protein|nr:hypothetical protein IMSAGC013_02583 [Lachnospiraceae bacterium]
MQKNVAENLRMLLLCLCFLFLLKVLQAKAAVLEPTEEYELGEETEEYELGEEYEGKISYSEKKRCFRFTVPEKSHVTLYLKYSGKGCGGTIYDEFGKEVLRREDLTFQLNIFTGWASAELSRTLPPGTYYMKIWNEGEWKWQHCRFSFRIEARKPLKILYIFCLYSFKKY